MSGVFPPEMLKKKQDRLSFWSFPGYSIGQGAGQNQIWILKSHLWASWVQNQTTDIAHIAAAPQALGDNHYRVSLWFPPALARARGMRADVPPPDRSQLCPMENAIWDEWEPASSQTGFVGWWWDHPTVTTVSSSSHLFPGKSLPQHSIKILSQRCLLLEKVKRAKELHENQKYAQVNRGEGEKCGKEMYLLRGWRGKVCLRADSPEEVHKSWNKWFVTTMFWGMWLRVLNFWG